MAKSIYKNLGMVPIGDVKDPAVIQNIIKHKVNPDTVKMIADADMKHRCRQWYFSESGLGFIGVKSKALLNANGKKYKRNWILKAGQIHSGENDLSAIIVGRQTKFIYKSKQVTFEPKLFLNGVEKSPVSSIAIIENGSLVWDYGFCKRVIENIEGMFREYYLFESNPKGEFKVESPSVGSKDLFSEPMAWDAGMYYSNGDYPGLILQKGKKVIPREVFENKEIHFPLFVDDSTIIQGDATRDGSLRAVSTTSKQKVFYGVSCSYLAYPVGVEYICGYYKFASSTWRMYRSLLAFDTDGVVQPNWVVRDMDLYLYLTYTGDDIAADDPVNVEWDSGVSLIHPIGSNEADYRALRGSSAIEDERIDNWTVGQMASMNLGVSPAGFNSTGWTYWSLRYKDARADSPGYGDETAKYKRYVKFASADAGTAANRPDLEITFTINNFPLVNLLIKRDEI